MNHFQWGSFGYFPLLEETEKDQGSTDYAEITCIGKLKEKTSNIADGLAAATWQQI